MSCFSTESQSTTSTETQSIASTETQSIASTEVQDMLVTIPRQVPQVYTSWIAYGVAHLCAGRQIIIDSDDYLRIWDLESGGLIGDCRRRSTGVRSMALSPNGKIIASGCGKGEVRLRNIETRKVIAKWWGHTNIVCALCWSADGNQVLSGSSDGTVRVWDVESGKTVLTIKTGHIWVNVVIYSPDATKIATGGDYDYAVKIWDTRTGELLDRLGFEHDAVFSLAWTSDGKKLISGSYRLIRIFDTATWEVIADLQGHTDCITTISLSQNERFIASASLDTTVRLWNLDVKTEHQIGPPLQHEDCLRCATISPDGKLLVTNCGKGKVYTWDIHAILKEAGLEDLLPSSDVAADADAMQAVDDELSPDFFNDATDGVNSSTRTYGNYPRSSSRRPRPLVPSFGSVNTLFDRLLSLFRRSHSKTNKATELQQRPRRPLLHHGPRIVEVAPVKDREAIYTAPPPPEKTQQQSQPHAQGSSTTQPVPCANSTASRPRYAYPLPVRLLGHLVLLLCCAPPQHADANARPTQQQQDQSTGQAQPQVSSSQAQPTTPSTSTTIALDSIHTLAPGAASA